MSSTDLREELGVRPDPEFDLELPPGWSRREPDEGTEREMLAALKKRLMEAHRPELFAQTKAMLEGSFESMRRNGVFAFFSPTDPDPATVFLPASLNASIRSIVPPSVIAASVNECPEPATLTLRPAAVAAATVSAISSQLPGRTTSA